MPSTRLNDKIYGWLPTTVGRAGARKKAVEIAKDTLLQIKLNRFHPSQGVYAMYSFEDHILDNDTCSFHPGVLNREFQSVIHEEEVKCEVCAIGALFVGAISKYDNCTVEEADFIGNDDFLMIEKLKQYFQPDNLRLIEAVFEGAFCTTPRWLEVKARKYDPAWIEVHDDDCGFFGTDEFYALRDHIRKLHDRYGSATERMQYIMRNIIRNGGIFVLPQRVHY